MAEPNPNVSPPGVILNELLDQIMTRVGITEEELASQGGFLPIEARVSAINSAQRRISREAGPFQITRSLVTVADQVWYALPTNLLSFGFTVFNSANVENRFLAPVPFDNFSSGRRTTGDPTMYSIYGNRITFEPIPDAAAVTFSIQNETQAPNGGLAAGSTTAWADDASNLPAQGRFKVDSEIVGYGTIDTSTTPTDKIDVLDRGLENTTDAIHVYGSTATLQNIQLYIKGWPAQLSSGTLTGVPEIPIEFHDSLVPLACHSLMIRRDPKLAVACYQEYKDTMWGEGGAVDLYRSKKNTRIIYPSWGAKGRVRDNTLTFGAVTEAS